MEGSSTEDRVFIPFNFSAVLPFDSLSSAANQLPTIHATEPEGVLSTQWPVPFSNAASNCPSIEEQSEMCRLMLSTVQDEEWKRDISSQLAQNGSSFSHTFPWVPPFCNSLASNIQRTLKRTTPMVSPPKRSTPKRPRPHPSATTPSSPTTTPSTFHNTRSASHQQHQNQTPSRLRNKPNATPQLSHSQELKRQEHAKIIDNENFTNFVNLLRSFLRRPDDFAPSHHTNDPHSVLLATASLSDISDLHRSVQLVSDQAIVAHVPPDLLSNVISVLHMRVRHSIKEVSASDLDHFQSLVSHASLGVMAATTILSIISAPSAPRVLLVQEILDDLAQVFRTVAVSVVFPMSDPMFKSNFARNSRSKTNGRGTAAQRNSHRKRRTDDSEDSDADYSTKRSSSSRSVNKKDEKLLRHFASFLDGFTALFQQENHLPDDVVDKCAVVCVQSISVTGIVRLQSHAIRLVSMIFFCYPSRRLYILDEGRQAVKALPASRKHLRTYQLAEDQCSIRPSSALLCILLSTATNDSEEDRKSHGLLSDDNYDSWRDLRFKRYHRAMKLAVHVLDPLLEKVCADRDSELRASFQSFFEDLLILYGRPEWPAAELMLQTLSVSIIRKLRNSGEKSVYARVVGIETLGAIASKICELHGYDLGKGDEGSSHQLDSEKIEMERVKVLSFLRQKDSLQKDSAYSFLESLFLYDDNNVALNPRRRDSGSSDDHEQNGRHDDSESQLLEAVKSNALNRFDSILEQSARGEDTSRAEAVAALRYVCAHRSFASGLKTIITAICEGMHDHAPTIRAKSIKSLSSIDSSCQGLLRSFPNVLPFIEASCRDVSILARDAALELLSRSLLSESSDIPVEVNGRKLETDLFENTFEIVMKRMCDTATSVRKRAIGISRTVLSESLKVTISKTPLKEFGSAHNIRKHEERIIRICAGLVHRLDDPESSVRDLSERVLRFGLFGYDPTNTSTWGRGDDSEEAPQLARRLTSLYITLPSNIHISFMARVVHKAMLIKERPLLMSIISATVDELHGYEELMSKLCAGRASSEMPKSDIQKISLVSRKRVGCSSVICALGSLDASLIEPHCRSLAPSIKGVIDGAISESDLLGVQRILNVLEIGLGRSGITDTSLINEVLADVELIVCQSPTAMLEEASARCYCVVAEKANNYGAVEQSANAFKDFLDSQVDHIGEMYSKHDARTLIAFERHARCAIVRLGLLSRYGSLDKDFTTSVYETLTNFCNAVRPVDHRGLLCKATVRALSHFLIGHRAFLQEGTNTLLSFLEPESMNGESNIQNDSSLSSFDMIETPRKSEVTTSDGVKLCILQGFHELLRDEEERNATTDDGEPKTPKSNSFKPSYTEQTNLDHVVETNRQNSSLKSQPILAAEEDAEAGFLALSAQAMFPHVRACARSKQTNIRRTVANIVGLLVRQGLLLPANVVPCLFGLLLDRDLGCREYAMRVIAFIADRHSGMLTSATVPALRTCFKDAFDVRYPSNNESLSFERICAVSIDEKSGQSLLSAAIMSLRREQRRGVLENIMRQFDPRVIMVENARGEKVEVNNVVRGDDENDEDEDDMGVSGFVDMDVSECNITGRKRCELATLHFLAMTLACVDYTSGAGVGGSLTQGGGTAAAEARLKVAREDVTELVGIATRIISNSGQAILRMSKHVLRKGDYDAVAGDSALKKRSKVAMLASRISVLLSLKRHLKVERWKHSTRTSAEEHEDDHEHEHEGDVSGEGMSTSVSRMPEFHADRELLSVVGWGEMDSDMVSEECINRQLHSFIKLMNEDAIDEADLTVPTRRGKSGAGRTPRAGRGRTPNATPSESRNKKLSSRQVKVHSHVQVETSSLRKKRKRSYRQYRLPVVDLLNGDNGVVSEDDDDDDDEDYEC